MALTVGINSFAGDGPANAPDGFKAPIWTCSSLDAGPDKGYRVQVKEHTKRGMTVSVSSQSALGPRSVGSYLVSVVAPVNPRGHWVYVDKESSGRNLTLTISKSGAGRFSAIAENVTPHRGQLTCKRPLSTEN